MKPFVLCLLVCQVALHSFSQVKIGDNPQTADGSSILELESTDKGFLPPRLTTAQRNAIQNPALGLTIMNTDNECLEYYRSNGWTSVCPQPPVIITSGVSQIGGSTAVCGGVVLADNGLPVSARGVCWSENSNPLLSDQFTQDGQFDPEFDGHFSRNFQRGGFLRLF